MDGYNKNGFNSLGRHRNGSMYDDNGYDKFGYNKRGFNSDELNKNETYFDKEGYDTQGYNKQGYNRGGFDREGYDVRGFDINGFDRQGYNRQGEYKEYIYNYIKNNINIDINSKLNKNKLLTEEIKNIMLNIDKAQSSFDIKDYLASASHLRRAGEFFASEVLSSEGITFNTYDKTQFELIDKIDEYSLLPENEINILHEIRMLGNDAVHEGKEDKQYTEILLNQFKNLVHKWIENR